MNDEYKTIYLDELIQIGLEDGKYYLTFLNNQLMVRFDASDWNKLMTSIQRFLK